MKSKKILIVTGCLFAAPYLALAADGIEPVMIHPFHREFSMGNRGIGASLTDDKSSELNLEARSQIQLKRWGINPRIAPQTKNHRGFSLYEDTRIETLEMGFKVDGFPLCQFQVKFHETLKGGMAVFGNIPRIDVQKEFQLSDWPSMDFVGQRIVETLSMKGIDSQYHIEHKETCLWSVDDSLRPVWQADVIAGQRLYSVIADGQDVYRFEPKYFDVDGKAKTYPNNVNQAERQEYTLREMTGTGYLENKYFTTCVPAGTNLYACPPTAFNGPPYPLVKDTSLSYDYTPATNLDAFVQTSVFVNANRALEWLEQSGYTGFGTVPIRLHVHAVFDNDENNALYEPHKGYAVIYVGNGDGQILQNLGTDADVVSHELGHHIVYATIKRIDKEEPLVLHEGLADYLTFARTENACLGESICPDSSAQTRVCMIPKRCLRTAENDYTFGSKSLPREVHLRSQFISGMLWDLYAKDKIPLPDVTTLVLKTINLMVEDSGYVHWAVGMLLADDAFFGGKNCETIRNRLITRGLQEAVAGLSCQTIAEQTLFTATSTTRVSDYPPLQKTSSEAPVTTKKSKSCGVISANAAHGHDLSGLLLWFLPLLLTFIRRFRG